MKPIAWFFVAMILAGIAGSLYAQWACNQAAKEKSGLDGEWL